MEEIIEAILFAAHCHTGQVRKDGTTPYINHPLEVMHLLSTSAKIKDPEILMAAVLHDVVEDTPVSGEEIAQRFGERVAKIVLELSDDKTLTKEERKKQQLLHVHKISPEAKLVRICDKICNVYDILYAPPGTWDIRRRMEYLEWANAVVGKIRGTNVQLEKRFDALMQEGMQLLSK